MGGREGRHGEGKEEVVKDRWGRKGAERMGRQGGKRGVIYG